jgi:hypothetical protein
MPALDLFRSFDSWYEFVDSVRDDSLYAWKRHRTSHSQGDAAWAGTHNFASAVDLAIGRGWPEGRRMMTDFLALVAPTPEPFASVVYDVGGAVPAVPIFCAGDPACMMDWTNSEIATNPIVRLDYCNGGLQKVSASSLMLRGAAVLSLADSLELRGYSTEIRLVARTTGPDAVLLTEIVVKRAGENFDLDRLAFALAHPAVHRRLRFALIEQIAELESKFGASYGATRQHTPDSVPLGTIFIPGASLSETPDSAKLAVQIAAAAYFRTDLESAA